MNIAHVYRLCYEFMRKEPIYSALMTKGLALSQLATLAKHYNAELTEGAEGFTLARQVYDGDTLMSVSIVPGEDVPSPLTRSLKAVQRGYTFDTDAQGYFRQMRTSATCNNCNISERIDTREPSRCDLERGGDCSSC